MGVRAHLVQNRNFSVNRAYVGVNRHETRVALHYIRAPHYMYDVWCDSRRLWSTLGYTYSHIWAYERRAIQFNFEHDRIVWRGRTSIATKY